MNDSSDTEFPPPPRPRGGAPVPEATLRILARCDQLATITDEPGCITRSYLSPAMEKVDDTVARWMAEAGLEVEQDGAGNLIGVRSCGHDGAPVLVLGSHLDTVRDAGRFDGVLGVILALAVAEELGDEVLPFDLEIVAFADEEGLRFGVPFLGSRARIGELRGEVLGRCDAAGISVGKAIRDFGGDPESLGCHYEGRHCLGYLEAHIEQGPWLEHRRRPLGVLEALSGACWLQVGFEGQAGHAGTTPMELRQDAMPAAAELVLAVERVGLADDSLVATVGKLVPSPGASNVIPGRVDLSLDVRHPDSEQLAVAVDRLLTCGEEIAERRGLRFEHEVLHQLDGVTADGELSQILDEAVRATGVPPERLVVGAGHDALLMARRMGIAMLLLRSPGGISHHPDEAVVPGDVTLALEAMEGWVRRMARREVARHRDGGWRPTPEAANPIVGETSVDLDP